MASVGRPCIVAPKADYITQPTNRQKRHSLGVRRMVDASRLHLNGFGLTEPLEPRLEKLRVLHNEIAARYGTRGHLGMAFGIVEVVLKRRLDLVVPFGIRAEILFDDLDTGPLRAD